MLAHTLLHLSIVSTPPPNFVVLFMDDNGWGDSSVNDPSVKETPNMQTMGDEGIVFNDFHTGFSVCTASRGALLTGRLAPRTGVQGNFGPTSMYGMSPTELTIADVLRKTHNSHMVGKWHLGHNEGFHPTYRGFTTFTGLPYSGDMGCIDIVAKGCGVANNLGSPACPGLCPRDGPNPVNGGGHNFIVSFYCVTPNCIIIMR